MTPVSSCGIPRNRYAFRKSMPPVIVRLPGLGSDAACAHAGVRPHTITTATTMTRAPWASLRPVSIRALLPRAPLVGESEPDGADHLVLLRQTVIVQIEGGCCVAQPLIFYAAVNVP